MQFTTKEEQLKALVEKFPTSAVHSRDGGNGKPLLYYPIEIIRERLNEVFGADYEFRVGHVITTRTTMDMSCILTLRWVDGSTTVVEEWGSSDIEYSRNNPDRRVSDPAKNCASDALKRCLAFVGCGAELYHEDYRNEVQASGEIGGGAPEPKRPSPSRPAPNAPAAPSKPAEKAPARPAPSRPAPRR